MNAERASGVIANADDLGYVPGAFHGRLAQGGRFAVDLTAAGNAIGVVSGWRIGGLTIRGGLAAQPEGAGSLTGSRAFRAPASLSVAVTAASGKAFAWLGGLGAKPTRGVGSRAKRNVGRGGFSPSSWGSWVGLPPMRAAKPEGFVKRVAQKFCFARLHVIRPLLALTASLAVHPRVASRICGSATLLLPLLERHRIPVRHF